MPVGWVYRLCEECVGGGGGGGLMLESLDMMVDGRCEKRPEGRLFFDGMYFSIYGRTGIEREHVLCGIERVCS